MNRFLNIAMLLLLFVPWVKAQENQNDHCAKLKAKYEHIHMSRNSKTGVREPYKESYILQMGEDVSYFYCPQTHYMDSMRQDPEGKQILRRATDAAYQAMYADVTKRPHEILRQQGFVSGAPYRCFKNFSKGTMRVWDSANGDRYRYDTPTDDIEWTLLDSVKNILGYQCQLASTDYHGRRWFAWFASDIPVQNGPWQLHGLPGLIMEASTADGNWSFTITSFQQCDEPFKPNYEDDRYFISKRKSVLRLKANSSRNRSARIAAMTNGAVKLQQETEEDELMELDYKD